jgi:hypothetical protein
LPTPNNFPNTIKELLLKISMQIYFDKRIICSLCRTGLDLKKQKCLLCLEFEKKHLVFIYDTHFSTILTSIKIRLYKDIQAYKEKIRNNDNSSNNGTYDIPHSKQKMYFIKPPKKVPEISKSVPRCPKFQKKD